MLTELTSVDMGEGRGGSLTKGSCVSLQLKYACKEADVVQVPCDVLHDRAMEPASC